MSLRVKILLLLGGLFVALMGMAQAVQHLVVFPSFVSLERERAARNQDRCVEAIGREIELLSVHLSDWSSWDDTYQFIVDENEEYKSANLVPTMFTNNRLNVVCFLDLSGRVVWSAAYDLSNDEGMTFEDFSRPNLRLEHPLLRIQEFTGAVEGVMLTEHGPLLVASRRILNNENEGPVRGTMVMGKLLDEGQIQGIAERTHVELSVQTLSGGAGTTEAATAGQGSAWGDSPVLCEIDDGRVLRVDSVLRGIDGAPALLLTSRNPREITARGREAMSVALASDLVAGLAILVLLWAVLRRMVVGPLTCLTSHAIAVGQSNGLSKPMGMLRRDEIGTLAREFDSMVERLAESRAQMLKVARQAGQAEVATSVLHNVGNVLTSVKVSAGVVSDKLRRSEAPTLGQATQMMSEHRENLGEFLTRDERGRQIPGYLEQLAGVLVGENESMLREVESLSDALDHIQRIVAMQQVHARGQQLVEQADPVAIVENALRLSAEAVHSGRARVVRRFESEGTLPLDRHKVLQILVNLISNARQALQESGRADPELRVGVQQVSAAEGRVLRITVEDNGVGIGAEHLPRMFNLGFSMRPEGHGFGLHSAATLAREMGGRLSAGSEGPGRGATFTLDLPLGSQEGTSPCHTTSPTGDAS